VELKWLKDFEALAEHRSFSKAAKARHVTQPAFSRRIRSLEDWLGIILVDRELRPMTLTKAGLEFIGEAKTLMAKIDRTREHFRLNYGPSRGVLFFVQHSLAVSFFPQWLEKFSPWEDDNLVRVQTGNLSDMMAPFLSGTGDFLLCFLEPAVTDQATLGQVDFLQIGTDRLVPVSAVTKEGRALHHPRPGRPLKVLAYPDNSFLGEIVKQELASCMADGIHCHRVFENALADGLKALALQGQGVAWLPLSLVRHEIEKGVLTVLDAPLNVRDLKVVLYRSPKARRPELDKFWKQALKAGS
jgi:DNA-binding transcriptional LysR family regulator